MDASKTPTLLQTTQPKTKRASETDLQSRDLLVSAITADADLDSPA